MIRLRLSRRGGQAELYAEGHANFAAAGSDIVCAGVSALVFALGAAAGELWEKGLLTEEPTLSFAPGRAEIGFHASKKGRARAAGAFETVRAGLLLIAADYPENLRVEEGEDFVGTSE